jgi:PAS domain S-box-containing protein
MSPVTIVYIITIVLSIAVALLLVHLARLQARARIKYEKGLKAGVHNANYSLGESVLEEITELVDSKPDRQKVAKEISDIFNRELGKKVDQRVHELDKKYETIIKQKTQNEEVAWKKYKKVLAEKKETEAVIHSVAEGLVVVDEKGKVIMLNPAAERLLGVSKKNKIGQPISEGIREDQLISFIKDSRGSKDDREIEILSGQDETKKTLRASSAVIEDEDGKTVGMVSVLSDITKQKELDRLKANFLTSISHELRTPLVAIEKSISMMLSGMAGRMSNTQEEFLRIAERNLKRLTNLINDLLDLSKLEAGKVKLRPQLASIEKIIEDSVQTLGAWAKTKAINIKIGIQSDLPEIYMDPDKVIQVLNNLIGNAIKFTPDNGDIVIEARSDKEKKVIEVSVADSGIGIPEDDLSKVFDKFYQTGERTPTDISGTGVGLSIAKEVVELHGGEIWAENRDGGGAKFVFTLPMKL